MALHRIALLAALALAAAVACGPEQPVAQVAQQPAPASQPQPAAPAPEPAPAPAPRGAQTAGAPSPAVSPNTEEKPRYGGILKRAHPTDPAGFDPVQDTSINTLFLIAPIYSQLIGFDPQRGFEKLAPELAERWELSADAKRLTFSLRRGVTWHDGQPFTSADVKAHFERLISPPKGLFSSQRAPFLHISGIQAPDEATVVFNSEFGPASFLESFAGGHYMVVSKHVLERETRTDPTALRKKPEALVGTGPFVFAGYEPGVAFRVRKNPAYWDRGKPYLDGMDFLIIRDATTRFTALAVGRVHMAPHGSPSLTPPQGQQARQSFSKEIVLERVLGPFWIGAAFNATRSPFTDVRVRQALNLAVDRRAYLTLVAGGEAEGVGALGGLSPPGASFTLPREELVQLPGYRQPKEQDLARARQLLAEAGYHDGFRTRIMVRSDTPLWVDAALFFQDQWKKLGVEAQVETVEFATTTQRMLNGDFDVRIGGTAFNYPDPDQVLYASFASQGPNFLYFPKDAEVDRLLEAQRRELNPDRRREFARQAERRLLQDVAPAIVGHYSIYIYGTRREVGGWRALDYMLYNQERMDSVWLRQ